MSAAHLLVDAVPAGCEHLVVERLAEERVGETEADGAAHRRALFHDGRAGGFL